MSGGEFWTVQEGIKLYIEIPQLLFVMLDTGNS